MRSITFEAINDQRILAEDWNSLFTELQTIIAKAGIVQSSVVTQISQSISRACHTGATFYADGGAANAYVLSPLNNVLASPYDAPTLLFDGLYAEFRATNSNTGASTVNVNGLGVRPIIDYQGNPLAADAITADAYITLQYRSAVDSFYLIDTSDFVLNGNSGGTTPGGDTRPIGFISTIATPGSPGSDWIICDGSGYDTTTYADLFAIIGYTYGGAGSTFNVPDLRGRTGLGSSDMDVGGDLANTGGDEEHTLVLAELPSHNHRTGGFPNLFQEEGIFDQAGTLNDNDQTSTATGGDGAHDNVQPSIVMNYYIRAEAS